MSVSVREQDFDISAEMDALTHGNTEIGAVATFVGKVRGEAHGTSLQSMTLEHYPGMTEAELAAIEVEAVARFKLSASRIIHRIGVTETWRQHRLCHDLLATPQRCLCCLRISDGLSKDPGPVLEKRDRPERRRPLGRCARMR